MNDNNSRGNILLVDDVLDNLRLLTRVLLDYRYEVRAVKSGQEALASILNSIPDLILLDVKLPDMDGYTVCKRLKSNDSTKDIPIIFLSALDSTHDKIKGFQVGGVDYITKPFQTEEVLSRVQTHLTISSMRAQLEQQAKTLRESEENLSVTLNSIGDGVIATDFHGLVIHMNPAAEKMCGWNLDEAIGKRLTEVFRIINKDSRQPVNHAVQKVLEKGEVVGLANHTILISRNGTERQILDRAAPIKNLDGNIRGMVLIFSDVTADYINKSMIEASEIRYRCLFEAAKDGILILDAETGMIVDVNPFLTELLGYTHEMFLQKKIWEVGLFKDIIANKANFLELQQKE